jgi:hypothetical protein
MASTDGISWIQVPSPTDRRVTALTAFGGWLVGVGDAGIVIVSRDGLQWEARGPGLTTRLSGVCGGGGQFLAVGEAGHVLASLVQGPGEVGMALPVAPRGGPFGFTVYGPTNATVTVQASDNLRTWTTLYQLPGEMLPARAWGTDAAGAPLRFYRAMVLSR